MSIRSIVKTPILEPHPSAVNSTGTSVSPAPNTVKANDGSTISWTASDTGLSASGEDQTVVITISTSAFIATQVVAYSTSKSSTPYLTLTSTANSKDSMVSLVIAAEQDRITATINNIDVNGVTGVATLSGSVGGKTVSSSNPINLSTTPVTSFFAELPPGAFKSQFAASAYFSPMFQQLTAERIAAAQAGRPTPVVITPAGTSHPAGPARVAHTVDPVTGTGYGFSPKQEVSLGNALYKTGMSLLSPMLAGLAITGGGSTPVSVPGVIVGGLFMFGGQVLLDIVQQPATTAPAPVSAPTSSTQDPSSTTGDTSESSGVATGGSDGGGSATGDTGSTAAGISSDSSSGDVTSGQSDSGPGSGDATGDSSASNGIASNGDTGATGVSDGDGTSSSSSDGDSSSSSSSGSSDSSSSSNGDSSSSGDGSADGGSGGDSGGGGDTEAGRTIPAAPDSGGTTSGTSGATLVSGGGGGSKPSSGGTTLPGSGPEKNR